MKTQDVQMQPVVAAPLDSNLHLLSHKTHCRNATRPHCYCKVDNLSNEGWQVAAVWRLSSVRRCSRSTWGHEIWLVNAVFIQMPFFPQFASAPSTRKGNHYLLTPYLSTSSQEWKNQLFIVCECALNHPLFSISMYGAAV